VINSNTEFKSIRTNLKLWIEQVAVKQWGRNRWGREAYMAEREGVGRHGGEVCGPRRRRVRLLRQEAPDLSGGAEEKVEGTPTTPVAVTPAIPAAATRLRWRTAAKRQRCGRVEETVIPRRAMEN